MDDDDDDDNDNEGDAGGQAWKNTNLLSRTKRKCQSMCVVFLNAIPVHF